jgi:hypothetical protein
MVGGGDDFIILFASLEQIDYSFPVGNADDDKCPLTKDGTPMKGRALFEFQIDPNNALKIMPLMRASGALLKNALVNRLYIETDATVFDNLIAKYAAADFRGNMEIVRNLENVAQIEMQKTFTNYGISLTRLITKWERNDYDQALADMRAMETAFMKANAEHVDWTKRANVKHEQIMTAVDFQFHEQAEKIKDGERLITLKLQEQMAQVDLKEEMKDKTFDKDLGREDRSFEQDTQHQYKKAQSDDYQEKLEIERDRTEMQNLMDIKKQQKEAKVMEYQGTVLESEKVDADTEKHKATMEAEAKKYDLGTYRSALTDERDHQANVMAQTANIMNAAKQHVPHTLVQGGGGGGGGDGAQVRIVEGNIQQQAPQESKGAPSVCPSCNGPIAAGQKFCPGCGNPAPAPAAGSAGNKFCAGCGQKIDANQKFCPGCGNKIE